MELPAQEYYFIFAKYEKIIPLETNLFLCMENTQKNLNLVNFLIIFKNF